MTSWLKVSLSVLLLILTFGSGEGDDRIRYDKMDVYSGIVERFATTRVRSVISNLDNKSKELVFTFQLPKEGAFISKLTMSVGGREYYGVAKEKAKARQEYENRTSSGENVGLVESRGNERFQVSLNAGPLQQASFELEYQQLLTRYQSKYRLELNINPGRVVENLTLTVEAKESQGIKGSSVVKSDEFSTKTHSFTGVTVEYLPSKTDQLSDGEHGLSKDLFFEYDVIHPTDGGIGLVITKNGYFVQFFSPGVDGLQKLQICIVFVIDVSGSMQGTKIRQAIESLVVVINQLSDDDCIGIVQFESGVRRWQSQLVGVREFRSNAITYVRGLVARGGTNLNGGMLEGVSLLKNSCKNGSGKILVLLTDGQPTAGVTNSDAIVRNTIEAVGDSGISVNCLGFGEDLDYNLLERLSLNNNGVTRRIYVGRDAATQLIGFYQEITFPVLRDLEFNYCDQVEYSSKLSFPFLFAGGEIVVVGKFKDDASGFHCPVNISAHGNSTQVVFRGTVNTMATRDFPVERLVAYRRILLLLESRKIKGTNSTAVEQEALGLALKYNFVTELTSLIVVQAGNYTNDTAKPYIRVKPTASPRGTTSALNPQSGTLSFRFRIPSYHLPLLPPIPPTTPPTTSPPPPTTPTTSAPYVQCRGSYCINNRKGLCTPPSGGCAVTTCKSCYWSKQTRTTPSGCVYTVIGGDREAALSKWGKCVKRTFRTLYTKPSKRIKKPKHFKCLCPV